MEHKIEKIVVCQIEEKSLTENTDIEILQKEMGTKRKKKKKRKKISHKRKQRKKTGRKNNQQRTSNCKNNKLFNAGVMKF